MTCYQIWYNTADGEQKNDLISLNNSDFRALLLN